jgi:hypothetical protein
LLQCQPWPLTVELLSLVSALALAVALVLVALGTFVFGPGSALPLPLAYSLLRVGGPGDSVTHGGAISAWLICLG